jgi:hypothetical protein
MFNGKNSFVDFVSTQLFSTGGLKLRVSTISVTTFFSDTAGNLRIMGYRWHIDMEFWEKNEK